MKTIPVEFIASGFRHKQVCREGNLAIYVRSKVGSTDCHFETIRIKSHNGFKIPGTEKMSDPSEYYPGPNSWGKDGFTLGSLKDAVDKMDSLKS
jgi:hypothetical protein